MLSPAEIAALPPAGVYLVVYADSCNDGCEDTVVYPMPNADIAARFRRKAARLLAYEQEDKLDTGVCYVFSGCDYAISGLAEHYRFEAVDALVARLHASLDRLRVETDRELVKFTG